MSIDEQEEAELAELDWQIARLFDPKPLTVNETRRLGMEHERNTNKDRAEAAQYTANWRAAHPDLVVLQRFRFTERRKMARLEKRLLAS